MFALLGHRRPINDKKETPFGSRLTFEQHVAIDVIDPEGPPPGSAQETADLCFMDRQYCHCAKTLASTTSAPDDP